MKGLLRLHHMACVVVCKTDSGSATELRKTAIVFRSDRSQFVFVADTGIVPAAVPVRSAGRSRHVFYRSMYVAHPVLVLAEDRSTDAWGMIRAFACCSAHVCASTVPLMAVPSTCGKQNK